MITAAGHIDPRLQPRRTETRYARSKLRRAVTVAITSPSTRPPWDRAAAGARHVKTASTLGNKSGGRLGVQLATVSGYRNRGQMPDPDMKLGRAQAWKPSTIIAWHARRPRGGLGGRPSGSNESP